MNDRAPAATESLAEERFQALHELVKAAHAVLPRNAWDYLIGGTETETTLKRNRLALDSIAFRPRVLRDVSAVDCSATFLGKRLRIPVALAPVGSLETFDPGGGAAVAEAAEEFGNAFFISSVTQPGLEGSAAQAPNTLKIFQLYVRGEDAFIDDHARRAVDSGYDAFCITVDTAIYSRRERDIAKRFVKRWRANLAADAAFQAALDWRQIARFKERHRIPLIIKGIATAEDAEIACGHGVDGVYVSNHGGRQLDHGRGAIDVLPEVIEAVRGRARVIVDGGICRGTDVVKAMALGADLVAIGRLYCYGLAAAGSAGIIRVLELLEQEIRICLGLLGLTRFADLDRSCLHPAPPVVPPGIHSAFPLLRLPDEGY